MSMNRLSSPLCAADTDARVMAIGPPSCRGDTPPVNRPCTTSTIFVAVVHVCSAPVVTDRPKRIGARAVTCAQHAPGLAVERDPFRPGPYLLVLPGRRVRATRR